VVKIIIMKEITPQKYGHRYILLDQIGTGGMAEVFRAKQIGEEGFAKLIVIKRMLPSVAGDPAMVEHFIAEARLAALLQHENIAAVYDFGQIESVYFIAMEYLFGNNLHAVVQETLRRGQPLRVAQALLIIGKVCEGMAYAHALCDLQGRALGIIHRDLTPHNIFLTYDGKIKIIDFGIAKTELHDNQTRLGVVKGKISYMSPEQIGGGRLDRRSDIFTIGMLLYEMVTGKRMYSGDTAALVRKAVKVEYDRAEEVMPGLPDSLYKIIGRALEMDPDRRYQSCDEMLVDIEQCLGQMTPTPHPRTLQTMMVSLFERDYQEQHQLGIKALQAAAALETQGRTDKTVIIERDMFAAGAADPGGKLRVSTDNANGTRGRGSGLNRTGVWLAGGVVLLMLIGSVLLFSLYRSGAPEGRDDISTNVEVRPVTEPETAVRAAVEEANYARSQQIGELVRQAESARAAGRLAGSESDTALSYYRQAEALDPNDRRVKDGLKSLADDFAARAERAIATGDLTGALQQIEQGRAIAPESRRLAGLSKRLAGERQKRVTELTDRFEQALSENRLTTPAGDCALSYLDSLARFDRHNPLVGTGKMRIADRYADLADRSLKRFDIEAARHYVHEGLSVVNDHWRLLALQRDLQKSTPEVLLQGLEKNLKSIF